MILKQYPCKEEFSQLALTHNVIPVCAEILADTETPVSILQKFHNPDKALFLLESVEGGEHWARYSFMGLSAKSHVRVFANHVAIEESGEIKEIPHHGDPLNTLKEISSGYKPAQIRELPRFWSGFTGYMTYEMVSFFEEIPTRLEADKPYAHFIIPDAMIIFDNMNHTLTCMSICYTQNRDAQSCYMESHQHLKELIEKIFAPTIEKISAPDMNKSFNSGSSSQERKFSLQPATDHEAYIKGVETIKEHIIAGDIIQAVYSQPFFSDEPVDPVTLYRAQRYINPSPYMFFMNLGKFAIAGSSPETMVRLENRTATLRPIAGTRPRGKSEQEDRVLADELLNDEKERAEHLMLVDLGRNDLGRVAEVGSVQVTDLMFVERYSHVMHLVSNITCEMKKEFDAWDLLRATFPAGTLSGAPKIRAMEIISDLEKSPRGIYGGAAGYISFSGNMDLAITIRTATVEKSTEDNSYGKMTVQAGAGIVADSDPETEYHECLNKARSVERALKLALMHRGDMTMGRYSRPEADSAGGEPC